MCGFHLGEAKQFFRFPQWLGRVRRIAPSTLGFDESGELLRERFHAHKFKYRSADRIFLAIELNHIEVIRAFEYVVMNVPGARGAQPICKSPRVDCEAGKIRKRGHD